jgi:hypothetical protein
MALDYEALFGMVAVMVMVLEVAARVISGWPPPTEML